MPHTDFAVKVQIVRTLAMQFHAGCRLPFINLLEVFYSKLEIGPVCFDLRKGPIFFPYLKVRVILWMRTAAFSSLTNGTCNQKWKIFDASLKLTTLAAGQTWVPRGSVPHPPVPEVTAARVPDRPSTITRNSQLTLFYHRFSATCAPLWWWYAA